MNHRVASARQRSKLKDRMLREARLENDRLRESLEQLRAEYDTDVKQREAEVNRLMRHNEEILQAFRSKMDKKARAVNMSRLAQENRMLREEYERIMEENRQLREGTFV